MDKAIVCIGGVRKVYNVVRNLFEEEIQMDVVEVFRQNSHLVIAGAATTLCGAVVVKSWLRRKFLYITQVRCKECRNEYGQNHAKKVDQWD